MAEEDPKEEQPKEEEQPAAEEEQAAAEEEQPKEEEPKDEEPPKEDPPKEDEPKEDAPKEDEPKKDDDNKEEPKKEEPKKEEPKKDEPKKDEPKKEEQKEEKKDAPKKKKKKVGKVDKSEAAGKVGTHQSCWKAISKAKNPPINWYVTKPKKKSPGVIIIAKGKGGINELRDNLKGKSKEIRFALLRVESRDKAGSARAKFIYFKFIGTKANKMDRAQLVGKMSGIEECFPVKHLTIDCDESVESFNAKTLSREFLRVGGAHKPDEYDFGGGIVHKNK